MIFVQGIVLASHAYLLVATPFRALDPTWEEQSAIAGRNTIATLWRITLPVLKPALLGAAIFFFIISLETFDIPVTLGLTAHVKVLSTSIYWATYPETGQLADYGLASALSMVLLLATLCLLQLYQRQTRDVKQFVTITGRGYRPRRIELGPWRLPLFLMAILFIVIAVILPVFMLVWRSLLYFYMYPSPAAFARLNLDAYRAVFADRQIAGAVYNTLVMALSSGVVCVGLAALIAWLTVRAPVPRFYRDALRNLAFLPQAMPTIVIGLALIFIYIWLPVSIYGTIWIIALAMITRFLAYTTATMIAAQLQVSTDLDEASEISGAGRFRTYRRIIMPLIAPTMFSCLLWVFIHSIRELGMALMLYSARSEVLSTKVWLLWEEGRVADVCAVGVLTVVALIMLLALPWIIRRVHHLSKFMLPQLRLAEPRLGARAS
jgi:iron(III) transport system permease protein